MDTDMQELFKALKIDGTALELVLERMVVSNADNCIVGYTGGVWATAIVGKALVFCIPGDGETVSILNPMSGETITTDRLTASAAFTCVMVNHFWHRHAGIMSPAQNKAFERHYHDLRNGAYAKGSSVEPGAYFRYTD